MLIGIFIWLTVESYRYVVIRIEGDEYDEVVERKKNLVFLVFFLFLMGSASIVQTIIHIMYSWAICNDLKKNSKMNKTNWNKWTIFSISENLKWYFPRCFIFFNSVFAAAIVLKTYYLFLLPFLLRSFKGISAIELCYRWMNDECQNGGCDAGIMW